MPPALQGYGKPVSVQFFHGSALNAVDAKNRVSIPASFREAIRNRTGGTDLFLGVALRQGCLAGYDLVQQEKLNAELEARHGAANSAEREDDASKLFGLAEALTIDSAGRIVLPPILKRVGRIGSQALFVGAGTSFLVWNPELYLAQPGLDPQLAELARIHMEAKGL